MINDSSLNFHRSGRCCTKPLLACGGAASQRHPEAAVNTAVWLFDVSGLGLDKRAVKSEIRGPEEEEGEGSRVRRRRRNGKDEID